MADAEALMREARARLEEHVQALRSARQAAAPRLTRAVREQLASLAMGEASFEVRSSGRRAGSSGGDAVEFLIAPNPGVPAGPVREIASGGELSRVMLALITPAAAAPAHARVRAPRHDPLVFDEVDAGIGGHTARAVGARLRELGEDRQVLCITHLPQIASLGDRHFSIVKDTSADPTRATVVQLGEPEVVSELVRMLGADAATAPRAATPATCAAPPEPLQAARRRPRALLSLRWPRHDPALAAQSSGLARGRASPVGERVRAHGLRPGAPGRRTKLLVKHLSRGDVALVDHLDIDRVSAEELIAAGAVAVLNCRPSSCGSYPNLGPQLLVEAGILLIDLPDDALFERSPTATRSSCSPTSAGPGADAGREFPQGRGAHARRGA